MRALAWIGATLLAVVLLAAAAVVIVVKGGYGRELAQGAASTALGRDVAIGALDVDPGRTMVIHLADVDIANPDWAQGERAAHFDKIRIAVRAWPLLRLDVRMPFVEIDGGTLNAEVDADGRNNWSSAEIAGEVAAPDERAEFPAIDRMAVTNTQVTYVDLRRGLDLKGEASASIPGQVPVIHIELEGTLNGDPLTASFTGGPPEALRDAGTPYPVDVVVKQARTTATVKGTVDEPLNFRDFAVDMTLAGPSLSDILPELKLPLPITAPYKLTGLLTRAGNVWHFDKFDGVVGESDLAGTVQLDLTGEKPKLDGDLTSKQLRFRDLAGFIGLDPESIQPANRPDTAGKSAPAKKGLFPDVPLDVARLRAAELEVHLKASKVIAPNLPIEALEGTFTLTDARLLIRPLRLGTPGGGEIAGEMAINARQQVPSADIDVVLREVDLRPFFRDTMFIQEMGGAFSGRLYLIGTGQSLDDMLSVADGGISLGMRDGRISALLVEAAGVDIAEALLVAVTEDTPLPIRCARADIDVRKGLAQLRRVVIDTTDSTLIAAGEANLRDETADVQVEARAKDFSILDLAAPVRMHGPWRDPHVGLGGLDPLPFFEMGDQEDVNCAGLLRGLDAQLPRTR